MRPMPLFDRISGRIDQQSLRIGATTMTSRIAL
jgi:hypothetical protein